jgi:hypothetical protein
MQGFALRVGGDIDHVVGLAVAAAAAEGLFGDLEQSKAVYFKLLKRFIDRRRKESC